MLWLVDFMEGKLAAHLGSDGVWAEVVAEDGGDVAWCEALFLNVPKQLVLSGKAYLVFRLMTRGEGGGSAIGQLAGIEAGIDAGGSK